MKSILLLWLNLVLGSMPLLAQPFITQQPVDQVVTNGGSAVFNVAVSGTGPFTCQWRVNGTNFGIISTVAGNGTSGYSGDGGKATNAMFASPTSSIVDGMGNLFIADCNNHRIRKVTPDGFVTSVAGNGKAGYSGDGAAANAAMLQYPDSVALDQAGDLFIADGDNCRVRKVDTNGFISTVAGDGVSGYAGDGGDATNAEFSWAGAIIVDKVGNLFIADSFNARIRRVDTNGIITTIAGNGTFGYSGDGGPAISAQLLYPDSLAVDSSGNLFIADQWSPCVRKVDTNGFITTVAGDGISGCSGDGGDATNAKLESPTGVTADGVGNLFIADQDNRCIRKVDTNGIITTVAGTGFNGIRGDGGPSTITELIYPTGVAADNSGNLFITDQGDNRIRKVALSTTSLPPTSSLELDNISTNYFGNYSVVILGLNGSITSNVAVLDMAAFFLVQPQALTVWPGGAANFSVSAFSASPPAYQWALNGSNLTNATNASYSINDVTTNDGGIYTVTATNLYGGVLSEDALLTVDHICQPPADQLVTNGGTAVFSVSVSGTGPFTYQWLFNRTNLPASGIIATVAGNGNLGFSGDGGMATNATMAQPCGLTMDSTGNLFLADESGNRIRKLDTNGIITTVAGNGKFGYSGDGDVATNAELENPCDLAVDSAGNLFIADLYNNRIRKVGTNGFITTVAGNGTNGYSGDRGAAIEAELSHPCGVAVDRAGNLFIADQHNGRIRKVQRGYISTVAGNGTYGYSGDAGAATNAALAYPLGVAVDRLGNLFIADQDNQRIREVNTKGIIITVAGNGMAGYSGDGSMATNAVLSSPSGVMLDVEGNLFIADTDNNVIRRVDANGFIMTMAGNGSYGYSGDGGDAISAMLNYPWGVAVDQTGSLFIADTYNNRIRKVVGMPAYPPTLPTFLVANASSFDEGNYSVVISNSFGSAVSSVAVLTIINPPNILLSAISNGMINFTWNAQLNLTSHLQCATNLDVPIWQNLGGPVTATNGVLSASDILGTDVQKFYRVQWVQ